MTLHPRDSPFITSPLFEAAFCETRTRRRDTASAAAPPAREGAGKEKERHWKKVRGISTRDDTSTSKLSSSSSTSSPHQQQAHESFLDKMPPREKYLNSESLILPQVNLPRLLQVSKIINRSLSLLWAQTINSTYLFQTLIKYL